MMFEPPPTSGVYDLFSSLFAEPWNRSPAQAVSDSIDGYSDHDADERSEDAYNFLRALAPGCSDIQEVVARHDYEKEAARLKTISEWRDNVLEPESWFSAFDSGSRSTSVCEGSDEECEDA